MKWDDWFDQREEALNQLKENPLNATARAKYNEANERLRAFGFDV